MRTRARFVLIALVVLATAATWADPGTSALAESIAPSEISSRREAGQAPVVIDVRTPEEFAAGHIPGAVNIPFDEVAERISEVEAPHGVALYCMVGPRARRGETALLASGYTSVFHLEGGLAAWQAAGYPVEAQK